MSNRRPQAGNRCFTYGCCRYRRALFCQGATGRLVVLFQCLHRDFNGVPLIHLNPIKDSLLSLTTGFNSSSCLASESKCNSVDCSQTRKNSKKISRRLNNRTTPSVLMPENISIDEQDYGSHRSTIYRHVVLHARR